jgi:hypothetical protein
MFGYENFKNDFRSEEEMLIFLRAFVVWQWLHAADRHRFTDNEKSHITDAQDDLFSNLYLRLNQLHEESLAEYHDLEVELDETHIPSLDESTDSTNAWVYKQHLQQQRSRLFEHERQTGMAWVGGKIATDFMENRLDYLEEKYPDEDSLELITLANAELYTEATKRWYESMTVPILLTVFMTIAGGISVYGNEDVGAGLATIASGIYIPCAIATLHNAFIRGALIRENVLEHLDEEFGDFRERVDAMVRKRIHERWEAIGSLLIKSSATFLVLMMMFLNFAAVSAFAEDIRADVVDATGFAQVMEESSSNTLVFEISPTEVTREVMVPSTATPPPPSPTAIPTFTGTSIDNESQQSDSGNNHSSGEQLTAIGTYTVPNSVASQNVREAPGLDARFTAPALEAGESVTVMEYTESEIGGYRWMRVTDLPARISNRVEDDAEFWVADLTTGFSEGGYNPHD